MQYQRRSGSLNPATFTHKMGEQMGVPIIFLIIAPLAAVIALLLSAPFSRAAILLSLIFSACGLVLLYRCLLLPLRKFINTISQPAGLEARPVPTSCDMVNALQGHIRARETTLHNDLAEARDTIENLRQEIHLLREKHAVFSQAQQTNIEALRNTQSGLETLAAWVEDGDISAEERARHKKLIGDFLTSLQRSECILLQSKEFLDSDGKSNDPFEQLLPEAFPWKQEYNTNIPVVDGQHMLLLSYINKLHRGMQKGCNNKLLLDILDDLTGYAFTHFATEELFFARTDYPLTSKHMEEHHKFRETVAQLRDAVLDDKAFIDIALLEYLKTWLVEHIQRMDTGFVPYVMGAKGKQ